MKKYIQYALRPGTGRTIPQASVKVKVSPSTELSPNATVYSANEAILANEVAQPFLCTAAGLLEFYAEGGRYDIYISYEDIDYVLSDVFIPEDTGAAAAYESMSFVTYAAENGLSNETVVPTFINHPDAIPAVAGVGDDEFGDIDLAWTEYNFTGTKSFVDSQLVYDSTIASVSPCVGIEKNLAIADLTPTTIWAKIALGYLPGYEGGEVTADRPFWGLGFKSSNGDIVSCGLRGGSQGISVFSMVFDVATLVSAEQGQLIGSNACYVRMKIISYSEIQFEWSLDGKSWVTFQVDKSTPFTGTIAKVGFYAYNALGTDGYVHNSADFIRIVSGS